MIDPSLFTVPQLLSVMLDDHCGNNDPWRRHAEIVPKYQPPYPSKHTRPTCVVKLGYLFLRHSVGPWQGYFWDTYGDDMHSPELALLALLQAPAPPFILKREAIDGTLFNGERRKSE